MWGWIFCDLYDIVGIFDGDYAIWDDNLVFELIFFCVLTYVFCILGNPLFAFWMVCFFYVF